MRLLLVLLVLAAGGVGAYAGYGALRGEEPAGAAKPAEVSPTKADRAAVAALLLVDDDFPSAWKAERAKTAAPSAFARPCPGGTAKLQKPRADAVSRRYGAGGRSAQVTAAAFAEVKAATAAVGAFMAPRDLGCLVGRLLDVPAGTVKPTSVDPPLSGDEAVAVRVRGGGRGTVDLVAVRQGRIVLVYAFGAAGEPWSLAERQALIDRTLARAPAIERS